MDTYRERYAFNFFVDNPKDIKDGTQQMMCKLLDYIVESDYVKIDSLLKESKVMRYSIQGYEEDVDISDEIKEKLMSAGYASALVDAMQLYVEKISAQNEILKVNTKYKNTVLRILEKRGTLLHGDLASALGVSPSALNAIIKQMNGTSVKLISVEQISKYKLYSLTPIAYKYIIKQEQDHFPRKKLMFGQETKGYVQTSKYKGHRFYDKLYIETQDKEENQEIKTLKKITQTLPKYSEKAMYDTQMLKYKKKLA